jgi:hypothetical protein
MTASSILNVWDQCVGKNQPYKGVALASLASAERDRGNIVNWSIEKRDVALFHVRKTLFGNQFQNLSHCPECAQTVEWDFSFHQMGIPRLNEIPDNVEIPITIGENNVLLRLPNSEDLFRNDAKQIIQNCILHPPVNGAQEVDKQMPDEILNEINNEFNKICRASNISYSLSCVECKHEWQVSFDIVSYLWKEIDHWAKRFMDQIAVLAKNFGWSESDIINMPENRRNHYLNLVTL